MFNHPDTAAAILRPFVSEANLWMVQNHGIFQGYYFWHYIGLDRNTRDKFADSPHYGYTEEFCAKYDQNCFDPDYDWLPVEHFDPALRAFYYARVIEIPTPRWTAYDQVRFGKKQNLIEPQLARIARFYAHESCAQCTQCRGILFDKQA